MTDPQISPWPAVAVVCVIAIVYLYLAWRGKLP